MTQIFEFVMLICFGMSWPISVYKSITSKSTQGKSLVFILAIIVGYVCGIIGKILSGQINYVLGLYIFNLIVVSIDLALYFVNKHNEKVIVKNESTQNKRHQPVN
ncbi:MAG: hypothetical protein IJ298_07935 [Ruminococcus sp.]|nr:hypothetical protein [Ruminococcus sp.]